MIRSLALEVGTYVLHRALEGEHMFPRSLESGTYVFLPVLKGVGGTYVLLPDPLPDVF